MVLMVGGCANVRLPAIDPSGQHILLPPPNYTTLNTAHQKATGEGHRCRLFRKNRNDADLAFQSPSTPPNCQQSAIMPSGNPALPELDPIPADPVAPRVITVGTCQQPQEAAEDANRGCFGNTRTASDPQSVVSLAPREQVAMVGSEVVLLAGVCRSDGYFVKREPLEWALAQGSVGNFVDPGQTFVGKLGLRGRVSEIFAEPLPEMVSNNYAVGITSNKTQVLTRGTVVTTDDVIVQSGQAWIGVTSPVEGTSYVTVMAPALDGWEQRTQTVVVQWVDAQWEMPPSAIINGNQPHTLTTKVTRKLSGAAATNYVVNYQILDPTATFSDGSTSSDVPVDTNGLASIQVRPISPNGGTTRVSVQVVRPARGQFDRLTLGQGEAALTWTTSQVAAQIRGPQSVSLNESARYELEVRNTGTLAADNVLLRALVPAGFELLSASIQPQTTGGRLDWTIGTLGPSESRLIEVTYRASQSGTARHCVSVQYPGAMPIEDCLTTQVTAEALFIEMLGPNPDVPLPVGQEILYQVSVTNRSDRRLSGVLLSDRFDAGLQHSSGASPLEWAIGSLGPRETRKVGLRFRTLAPGKHCHVLEVTASDAPPARTNACVTVAAQAQPDVSINKTGPNQMVVGQEQEFLIVVKNTSNTPISNLQVIDTYDPEFRFMRAEPQEANSGPQGIMWYITRLGPGESQTFRVTCQAMFDVRQACTRSFVRGPGGLERTDQHCLAILPGSSAPGNFTPNSPRTIGPPPGAVPLPGTSALPSRGAPRDDDLSRARQPDGELQVTIGGRGDRWQVGDTVAYQVTVRNNRPVADRDVVLTISLPSQATLVDYAGTVAAAETFGDRTLRMVPVRTLRPGESVSFEVTARLVTPGQLVAAARATSQRVPEGVTSQDVAMATS